MINFGRMYKQSKSFIGVGIGAVICVIACVIVWNRTKSHYENNPVILEDADTTIVPIVEDVVEEKITVSSETINESLSDIGTLNTYEYYFTHVGKYAETAQLFGYDVPFSESSYIYSYDGKVSAGLDFSAIEVEVDNDEKVITLTLPEIEITGFEIDPDSFKLFDESISPINHISVDTLATNISSIETEEKQNAIDKGVLDKAGENAELLIRDFMNGVYEGEGYTVVVKRTVSTMEN